MTAQPKTDSERDEVLGLIERIVREAPQRRPTSEDERRSQQILEELEWDEAEQAREEAKLATGKTDG